jgi:adenine/guanine phosphoribosyltransferase-like PRPP-binding protein
MNTRSLRCGPHEFWQELLPPEKPEPRIWRDYYAARLRDGRNILLPLRDYGTKAFAGFIANQASFTVVDTLAQWIAEDVRLVKPDMVVGLPTLGHVVGAAVARALGHTNWVAPGTTRKLWYDEALSVPTHSVTSPAVGRSMWLDPRLVERLSGRRVLLVDDVVTTGTSARAGLALLARAGVVPVALAVAMTQGEEWRNHWDPAIPVFAAFATPQFRREGDGWIPNTAVATDADTHSSTATGLSFTASGL